MKKLLANLKHLPTTIAGGAVVIAGIVQHPAIQQLAALNPKTANALTGIGAVAGGLALIFGTGGK